MKKFTSTLLGLLLCIYVTAQVGSPDPTFNPTSGFKITNTGSGPAINDQIQAMAIQADGSILTAGFGDDQNFTVARYTTTGALDGTFGTGGIVHYRANAGDAAQAYAIAVTMDGKIVVAGWTWPSNKDFCVMRLNRDGSLDNSFGTNGVVSTDVGGGVDEARSVAIQNDGSIVVAGFSNNGTNNDFAVVRYTSGGVIDPSFGSGGKVTTNISSDDVAESVVINNTSGAIIVGGTSNTGGPGNFAVVQYTSLGAPDPSFGSGGIMTTDIGSGTNDQGHALALQKDGSILLAGSTTPGGNKDVAVVRYTTIGGLDPGFGSGGIVTTNYGVVNTDDDARSIAVQNDGKIVVGGATDGAGSSFAFLAIRYLSNGGPDNSFGSSSKAAADLSVTDPDISFGIKLVNNRVYLGGYSGAPRDFALAALQSDGSPLPLTLTQFYAQKQTSKVLLQWQTSMEQDVKQFIIERSNDGKTYTAIGDVAAAGNSTTTKNYSYTDQSPYTSVNNYYRLLMQDIDGNYKYSKVLIVKFTGALSTSVQVFPSPVKDILQVQLPGGLSGSIGLEIIDINGRIVKRNNIASDGNALNTSFDVSSLQNGVYVLKAQAGNTIVTTRFTKL